MSNVIPFRPRAKPTLCNHCGGAGSFKTKNFHRIPCPICAGKGVVEPKDQATK